MAGAWQTRIEALSPTHAIVAVASKLRLRVVGWALGSVTCGGERRIVWGRFNETFAVDASERVSVVASGLTGRVRRDVCLSPQHDLHPPRSPRRRPRMSRRRFRSSPLRPSAPRTAPRAPRVNVPAPRTRHSREELSRALARAIPR